MLNKVLNAYFGFNRQQRNGLLVLVCISFTLLVIRIAYPYFITPAPLVIRDLPLVEQKIDSGYAHAAKQYEKEEAIVNSKQYFVFDPNTVSAEQLKQLGFKEKTAATFLKFRSRGFIFKTKEDLQKVYGISQQFYNELEPYMVIKAQATGEVQPVKEAAAAKAEPVVQRPAEMTRVELNSADSAALVALKGIGAGYARRILKYRSLLGGFVTIEQLKEVYGFTDELYASLQPALSVNPALVKKINLNTDDFKTINKHPYLGYERTKQIFDWRRKTVITAVNLKEILNDDNLYRKLLPYLSFD